MGRGLRAQNSNIGGQVDMNLHMNYILFHNWFGKLGWTKEYAVLKQNKCTYSPFKRDTGNAILNILRRTASANFSLCNGPIGVFFAIIAS